MTDEAVTEQRSVLSLIHDMGERLHKRLDRVETALQSDLSAIRDRQTAIATAVHHIIKEGFSMSALTDTIRAEIAAVSDEVDSLVAQKQADDSAALADIKSDMDKLKGKVTAAMTSGSSTAPADSISGASASVTGAASDSVDGAASAAAPTTTSTTLPNGAPATITVDPAAGTTQAVVTDPSTGVAMTTTVQHADGSAATVDPNGTPVATSADAAQAATQAAQAAGVAVPAAS